MSYFKSHRKSIIFVLFISVAVSFSFFFNKKYNTKISYTVNSDQSFQSNILASNLLGKSENTVFSGLVQRTFNHANSRHFLKQLSAKIMKEPNISYIYQKAITLADHQADIHNDSNNQKLLILTDFLEDRINVRLKNDNEIIFSITTGSPLLTESIQKLLNDFAKTLLTKDPLKEVLNASQILNKELESISNSIVELDKEKIKIQKEFNTLNPVSLATSYSELDTTLQKDLYQSESELSSTRKQISAILAKLRRFPRNFSLKEELNKLRKHREELKSKIKSTKSSIKEITAKSKDLPKLLADLQAIERKQEIKLKSIVRLTEQKSIADISIQKIRDSISLLTADENVKSSSNITLAIKTTIISFLFVGLYLTLLYYKQHFLPVIMRADDVIKSRFDIVTSFSNFKKFKKLSNASISSNKLAVEQLFKRVSKFDIISLIKVGKTSESTSAINSLLEKTISSDKSIFLLNFHPSFKQKLFYRKLKDKSPHNFHFFNFEEKLNDTTVINPQFIRKILEHYLDCDYIYLNATNLRNEASKAILLNLSEKALAFATVNKTLHSELNNFVVFNNKLIKQYDLDLSLILTNVNTNENISNYIKGSLSVQKDEDRKAS